MAIVDKNRIYDGFDSLEGGVDAGRRSNVLGLNQCESAENAVFRGGIPGTRPGIRLMEQHFHNDLSCYPKGYYTLTPITGAQTQDVFQNGIFQAACYYSSHNQSECIIAVIGGRIFRIDPGASQHMHITEILVGQIDVAPIGSRRNRNDLPDAWIIQADKWVIIQNGQNLPILYDGTTARRAASDEVPTGTIMAYGMGRIVVVANGQDIFFGDLYGSHAGTDAGDSVIKFTETTFISEGFPASIPTQLGKITAAAFFPQLDTSTGTGQLFVYTDRGAASFNLAIPRDQWKTSAFSQIALMSTGVRGWRTVQVVNEDQWFRSSDGARTFRQARSEAAGWFHIPLSTNVRQWLDVDAPELLDYASAIYFDNRYILTTTPIWNHRRPYHNGLLVLDFDILSSFGTNSRPAWNGHWSKIKTAQLVSGIFKGKRRAFAFGIDDAGLNQIYELSLGDRDDFDGPISGEMITRSFDFSRDSASNPFSEKELYGGDLWVNNVGDENATITATYRPDDYPDWLPWDNAIPLTIIGSYGAITEGIVPTMNPGFYPRQTLEKPNGSVDTNSTKRSLRRGYSFQAKLNWTGQLNIERFRIQAQLLVEKATATS